MTKPCFYTAITTIVAFCSLIVSDIRPVIDFGWMMTIGIALAFVLNFIYFPAVLVLLKPEKVIALRTECHAKVSVYHGGGRLHPQVRQADCGGLRAGGRAGRPGDRDNWRWKTGLSIISKARPKFTGAWNWWTRSWGEPFRWTL